MKMRTLAMPAISGAVLLAGLSASAQTAPETPSTVSPAGGTSATTTVPPTGSTAVTVTGPITTTITVTLPGTSNTAVVNFAAPRSTGVMASAGGTTTSAWAATTLNFAPPSTVSGFNGTLGTASLGASPSGSVGGATAGLSGFSGFSANATSAYAGAVAGISGSQGPAYIDVPGMGP